MMLPVDPVVIAVAGGGAIGGGWLVRWWLHTEPITASTGRGRFEPEEGKREWVRERMASGDVEVDGVMRRDPDGPRKPEFRETVSTIALGETGMGKSTFVKSRLVAWDFSGAIVAHALSNPGDENEFAEFFGQRGQQVIRLSSRNSTHRWDPFLDYTETMRDMETIASGIFATRPVKETGWTEPARSMLVCALTLTSALYGDFADLTTILGKGPEWITQEVQKIDRASLAAMPIVDLDEDARQTVFTTLVNQIRPLLYSEIVESDIPRLSLRDYFESPGDSTIVLDNVREDRYARGFWRFLLQSGIDVAFSTAGTQQFLLDEFDKLPHIDNLDELASAGRSAGVIGMLVAQDVHQLEDKYGNMAHSLYANCPNRICFKAADRETANLALSTLGTVELMGQSISVDPGENEVSGVSQSVDEKIPLLSGDITGLSIGEALIQSPEGWWLADLTEPELSMTETVDADRERDRIEGTRRPPVEEAKTDGGNRQ